MTERTDWSDARLTDTFHSIERRLSTVEGVNIRLASVETELGFIHADTRECSENMKALRDSIDQRNSDAVKEKKSERRFLVTTVFGACGLVISALAIFAGKF